MGLPQVSQLPFWLVVDRISSIIHSHCNDYPDSKVHGANMGPIWGRQGPGGPHVGPMNFVIWVLVTHETKAFCSKFFQNIPVSTPGLVYWQILI